MIDDTPVQAEFKDFTDPNDAPVPAGDTPPPADTPAPKADDAPPADGAAPKGEDKTDPPADEGDKQPKGKNSAQERIAEITRARREAERRAEDAERRLAEIEARAPKQAKQDDPAPADGEPDATKYEYGEADPKFIRDLARYEARQEFAEQSARERQQQQIQERDRSWETAQDAARSKHADYDEVVTEGAKDGKWPCTPAMAEAIKTSEAGPEVAYHLASNPDEARRIAALNPVSQIRELGRLEARLTAPTPKEPPKGKTATDAPPPPEGQARGAGGKFQVSDDTDDYAAFEAKHFPK